MKKGSKLCVTLLLIFSLLLSNICIFAENPEPKTLIEAETLTVMGENWEVQGNSIFSGGSQIFWRATGEGDTLEITFSVTEDATYYMSLGLVSAGDFGMFQVSVDGTDYVEIDAYRNGLMTPCQEVGSMQLSAGTHTLELEVTGKNERASNYFVGIDYIALDTAGWGTFCFEGEELLFQSATGVAQPWIQGLDFTSNGAHMIWQPAGAEESVTYSVYVPEDGTYQWNFSMTVNGDFGLYEVYLDNISLGEMDFYDTQLTTKMYETNEIEMTKGYHVLKMTCLGKNDSSSHFVSGIDYIERVFVAPEKEYNYPEDEKIISTIDKNMEIGPSGDNYGMVFEDLAAGVYKVAYYMTIDSVRDGAQMRISPIVGSYRCWIDWKTTVEMNGHTAVKPFMEEHDTNKVILVNVIKVPENGLSIDAGFWQDDNAYVGTLDKVVLATDGYDFINETEYTWVDEKGYRGNEPDTSFGEDSEQKLLAVEGDWTMSTRPEVDDGNEGADDDESQTGGVIKEFMGIDGVLAAESVDYAVKNEETGAVTLNLGYRAHVYGMAVGGEDLAPYIGKVVKTAFYITVNEVGNTEAQMRVNPFIKGQEPWVERWVDQPYGDLVAYEGEKIIIVGAYTIPETYNEIEVRLWLDEGISITIDKVVVAANEYNFANDAEYTLVLEGADAEDAYAVENLILSEPTSGDDENEDDKEQTPVTGDMSLMLALVTMGAAAIGSLKLKKK